MRMRLIVGSLAVMLIMIAVSAPANASEPLLLSRDGSRWSPHLVGPAFDPEVRWVPGDERSTALWAKNNSAEPARLAIDLVDVDGASLLAGDFVDLGVVIGDAPPKAVGPGRILTVPSTREGEEIEIIITASLPESSANGSQGERLTFDLVAELRQIPDGPVSSPPVATPPVDGSLPGTGARSGLVLLTVLGLTGLTVGVISVSIGRRKVSRHDDPQPS